MGLERVERSKPKKTRVPDERNLFARGMDARISQVHARCGCGCETVSGLAGCARSGFAQSTSLQGGNGSLLMPEILVFRFKKPSLFLKKISVIYLDLQDGSCNYSAVSMAGLGYTISEAA